LLIFGEPSRLFLILSAGLLVIICTVQAGTGDREKARLLLAAGAYAEAIEYAEVLINEDSADVDARLVKASGLQSLGDYETARDEFLTVVELEPANIPANYNLAVLAAAAGELDKALGYARVVVEADTEYAEAWLLIGKAAAATGDDDTAHDAYVEYLKRRPPTDDLYIELAKIERRRREWGLAVSYYRLAAEKEGKPDVILKEIATTLMEAGRSAEAVAAWAEARDLTSGEAEKINAIGLNLLVEGEYGTAVEAFALAAEAAPEKAIYVFNGGLALHLAGDIYGAEAIYRELADASEPVPEAVYNLAVILDGRGESEAAKAYYRKFLLTAESRPDLGEKAIAVRERLTDIEAGK
jgi:tetratricopeptide (TPR) repeat protein